MREKAVYSSRPGVVVQTVYFDPLDRSVAEEIGEELYGRLTRPLEDLLSYSGNVLVYQAMTPAHVDLASADLLLLVPVVGGMALNSNRQDIIKMLESWSENLGEGQVLVVPLAENGRGLETVLPRVQILSEIYGGMNGRRQTIDQILISLGQLVQGSEDRVQLFISHAKADLIETEKAAEKIKNYVLTDTRANAFFDARNLTPGKKLHEQIRDALEKGLLLVVRSDRYSSRPWCQEELLIAKRHKLPTLTVDLLQAGELRSLAYGGNGPSIVWADNPADIVTRALAEFVRAAAFKRRWNRAIKEGHLPADSEVLSRPPELLDLVQGPLNRQRNIVVVHPDPDLPVVEREVLRRANPRLRLVTPTTSFRRVLAGGGIKRVPDLEEENPLDRMANPLEGLKLALSLSDSPDAGGEAGFTEHHVHDAAAFLCRCLISSGAAIAYGGDFREGGYTEGLARLVAAYNQTASDPEDFLLHYAPADMSLEEIPTDVQFTSLHLGRGDLAEKTQLPRPPADEGLPNGLYLSDMRRLMAEETDARVVLGGATRPSSGKEGSRFQGVVEEVWWTLEAAKPLYVVGGYGGAAGLIVDLFQAGQLPAALRDATWMKDERFRQLAERFEEDPYAKKLGVPASIDEMAISISQKLQGLLGQSNVADWNGLTRDENLLLARSRDPSLIASLVIKGLLNLSYRQSRGKLRIELVHGSVVHAQNLDAVAISVVDRQDLGGAGAALDRALNGRASLARAAGHSLIGLDSENVDAGWLYLASLGLPSGLDDIPECIQEASRKTARMAEKYGFRRVGINTFGASLASDSREAVNAMVRGFESTAGTTTLVWFENDETRYQEIWGVLRDKSKTVAVTTRRQEIDSEEPTREELKKLGLLRDNELWVHVSLLGEQLKTTAIPPAGTGVVSTQVSQLTAADLTALTRGSGKTRGTPRLDELRKRGFGVSKLLFGENATKLLRHCSDSRVTVVHDPASSRIPFELMLTELEDGELLRPAAAHGLNRRLAVGGLSVAQALGQPLRVGPLILLLVVNPTEDPELTGVEEEARQIQSILQGQAQIKIEVLSGREATIERAKESLAYADILHYGGHGYFTGPGKEGSGLLLADGRLTLSKLVGASLPTRFAFVNSCETGRVRASDSVAEGMPAQTKASAFAEIFLRSGIEAYLGTYWQVNDVEAAAFAATVYASLAMGDTLDSSVRQARVELLEQGKRNWCNYILYGDGRFCLRHS